jgi:co-chaperonin GroES (HSP10)
MLMKHDIDPAQEIWAKVGTVDNLDLFFSQVLIGIYQRPETTRSGIILTSRTLDEDIYQGKVGLVLKIGPTAFKDEGDLKFHGQTVKVGDWIVFRPSDGWQISINKTECRMLRDVDVKATVSTPDAIW